MSDFMSLLVEKTRLIINSVLFFNLVCLVAKTHYKTLYYTLWMINFWSVLASIWIMFTCQWHISCVKKEFYWNTEIHPQFPFLLFFSFRSPINKCQQLLILRFNISDLARHLLLLMSIFNFTYLPFEQVFSLSPLSLEFIIFLLAW